jgi:hypothetical protein
MHGPDIDYATVAQTPYYLDKILRVDRIRRMPKRLVSAPAQHKGVEFFRSTWKRRCGQSRERGIVKPIVK